MTKEQLEDYYFRSLVLDGTLVLHQDLACIMLSYLWVAGIPIRNKRM